MGQDQTKPHLKNKKQTLNNSTEKIESIIYI